ncbi:MAG: hypothetical protein ACO3JL_18975, partial [Myxococcota bacterium]
HGDGLMLHGAACISAGTGLVLVGLSGAGKSTFAQGLSDSLYLSDDIAIIDRLSSLPRLVPSPFHGALGRLGADADAPLGGIAILEHGEEETLLTPLPAAKAVSALLRHVVCFGHDQTLAEAILDLVIKLVQCVPVFSLRRSLLDGAETVCERLRVAGAAR